MWIHPNSGWDVTTSVLPTGVDSWIDRIGIMLFDAASSATLFFSLVLLAMLACRQPARRILIARVALLASLGIVPLIGLQSLPRLDVVKMLLASDLVPRSLFVSLSPGESSHLAPTQPIAIVRADQDESHPLHSSDFRPLRWIGRALILLELTGIGAGLAWLLLGFAGVHWLIWNSRNPTSGTLELYNQVLQEGTRRSRFPELRVSERVQYPVVVGFIRPTILIPESLDLPTDDPQSLRLSLLHEIAHTERSDHRFGTIASLAQSLWFFLPHTWWLRSQLLIDQEFLADRAAASRYGTSSSYASSLLSMASSPGSKVMDRSSGFVTSWPAGGKIGVPSALFQRVLMLLHCPYTIEPRTPRLWSWALKLSVIGLSVFAACLVIRWPNAGAMETGSKAKPGPPSIRFEVSHFKAEPILGAPGGRSVAYHMTVLLPPRFDLDVNLRSTASDLGRIRIAGHLLKRDGKNATDALSTLESSSPDSMSWRHIHLHRDLRSVSIEIDGRLSAEDTFPEPTTEWLTIEPGSQNTAEFRELKVSW